MEKGKLDVSLKGTAGGGRGGQVISKFLASDRATLKQASKQTMAFR